MDIKCDKWDKLWEPELGGLPTIAEIILKSERYSPTMNPWLKRVKAEGDKLQKENEELRKTPEGIYQNIKGRVRHREKHKCIMTQNEFVEWYSSQEKRCVYCTLTYDEFKEFGKHYKKKMVRLTVDRKNNDGDYSVDNVVLACHRCNSIKGDTFTFEEMREIAQKYIIPKINEWRGVPKESEDYPRDYYGFRTKMIGGKKHFLYADKWLECHSLPRTKKQPEDKIVTNERLREIIHKAMEKIRTDPEIRKRIIEQSKELSRLTREDLDKHILEEKEK